MCAATTRWVLMRRSSDLQSWAKEHPKIFVGMIPFFLMQALLRWLDELAVDLDVAEGQALEEELQRTVEAALKVQAQRLQDDTLHPTRNSRKVQQR
jgi:hypothetical protein